MASMSIADNEVSYVHHYGENYTEMHTFDQEDPLRSRVTTWHYTERFVYIKTKEFYNGVLVNSVSKEIVRE